MSKESEYIVRRLGIGNKVVRLGVAALLWVGVFLACVGIILITALITVGGVLGLFGGALGLILFNAPEYLYKSLRNNL